MTPMDSPCCLSRQALRGRSRPTVKFGFDRLLEETALRATCEPYVLLIRIRQNRTTPEQVESVLK
jgi:hypothetical protein